MLIASQRCHPSLHFCQQCMGMPISPHPQRPLILKYFCFSVCWNWSFQETAYTSWALKGETRAWNSHQRHMHVCVCREWLYCTNTLGFPNIDLAWKHLGVSAPPSPMFSCLGQVEGVQGGPLGSVPGSSCPVGGHESPHRIHQPGHRRAILFGGDPGSAGQDAGRQPGHGVGGHHLPHLRRPRV